MACDIQEGDTGACGMYVRTGNAIRERYPDRYLAAVDSTIESMPMVHYHPRGKFLQVCTVGCNFRCEGCVSEVLTDHFHAIEGAFQEMSAEQIVQRARERECLGVMFCFNEPTVSYFTFRRLAILARENGLLVGCSTNGYMTESALSGLIPVLDFVNVGLKGASQSAYSACGVDRMAPIWRNLTALYRHGVHVEVSAIYRKGGEAEIGRIAEFMASLSRDIPLQVMRFIPFGDASADREPSVRESEAVCRQLRRQLRYVYLFNSPGTDDLNSRCPECGTKIMERGFFGPMASNLFRYLPQGRCNCGFELPLKGCIHDGDVRERGYFGGYRTINALKMIRALLGVLGVTDKAGIDAVLLKVLREDFIKELYQRLNRIDAFLETVDYFAALTDRHDRAAAFRCFVDSRLARIEAETEGREKPLVYSCLGHPLMAVFEEKMEAHLVETAGGRLANRLLDRESRPGILLSREQFCRMAPEIIIVSDASAWPVRDFIAYCRQNGLDAPAIRRQKVFHLQPFRASTNPDWILGLMRLVRIIHPDTFAWDLRKEADDFYREFYNRPFCEDHNLAFPWKRQKQARKTNHPVTTAPRR
jgi:pyruvate-formate lyase-activating enzyme